MCCAGCGVWGVRKSKVRGEFGTRQRCWVMCKVCSAGWCSSSSWNWDYCGLMTGKGVVISTVAGSVQGTNKLQCFTKYKTNSCNTELQQKVVVQNWKSNSKFCIKYKNTQYILALKYSVRPIMMSDIGHQR